MNRIREILRGLRSVRFPEPPDRRYDLIGETIDQALGGEGGGHGPIRKGGVEARRSQRRGADAPER